MPPKTWKTSISALFLVIVHINTVCTPWIGAFAVPQQEGLEVGPTDSCGQQEQLQGPAAENRRGGGGKMRCLLGIFTVYGAEKVFVHIILLWHLQL